MVSLLGRDNSSILPAGFGRDPVSHNCYPNPTGALLDNACRCETYSQKLSIIGFESRTFTLQTT